MPTERHAKRLGIGDDLADVLGELFVAGQRALHPQAVLIEQRARLGGRLALEDTAFDLGEAPAAHGLQRRGHVLGQALPDAVELEAQHPGNRQRGRGLGAESGRKRSHDGRGGKGVQELAAARRHNGAIIEVPGAGCQVLSAMPCRCRVQRQCRVLKRSRRGTMPLIDEGKKAPAFSLEDQDGKTHRLKDYAGRPVVLYFYPEGRHAGLHHRGVRVSRRPGGFLEGEGRRAGRQRARHQEQGEVRQEARAELPAAGRRRPRRRRRLRRVAGKEHVRPQVHGRGPHHLPDRP